MFNLLAKDRIIARPGFNRWLVPPSALAIHLSIGMAYGFSVFWLPLSKAVGITEAIPFPKEAGFWERLFSTTHDWSISWLGWMYTLFFVFLGGSAAVFGKWVERAGPRKAGVVAACCWGGGLMISALGVHLHQIWMLWLGSGVIGGIGLGLGYISPVATLVQWFPDRRGLATGMAIMGFGGGAMIGAPLANLLMGQFATSNSVGVWQTFVVLGAIYFAAMLIGAFGYRLPAPGWTPESTRSVGAGSVSDGSRSSRYVPVERAWRLPQFWLLWAVLCLNVSAGIGVLGMASPMLQEVFGGRLIGVELSFAQLDRDQLVLVAAVAAGFTGLLSLCNIVGRIGWASLSDRIGRKPTYAVFFLLGAVLYASVPMIQGGGGLAAFVGIFCVILSMYGGGFATIPAYLADSFGPKQISAIHGRLLTAWSVAGVLGPVAVNYIRDAQLADGVPASEAYNATMYLLSGLLVVGFVCNQLIRPVDARHFIEIETPALPRDANPDETQKLADSPTPTWLLVVAWGAVGIPLMWGVWNTLEKARVLLG